jgi:hypothetical protein
MRAMNVNWSGKTVETDELSINYARAGQGFPVIFLTFQYWRSASTVSRRISEALAAR